MIMNQRITTRKPHIFTTFPKRKPLHEPNNFTLIDFMIKIDDIHYLRFTMPKVDKDRRDVLTQGVDVFYKETKSQLDQAKAKYEPRLAEKLIKLSEQEADEAKQKFNDTYDAVVKMSEVLVNDKNQEIEEAYQRYLQQKDAADKTMQEQQAAQGEDVKNKLTFQS